MRVVILTFPGDFHAHAVACGIKARGHDCDLIFLGDLPQQAVLTVDPSLPASVLFNSGEDRVDFRDYDRFWLRRPSDALLPADIHPNDRRFARQAWDFLKESILRALGETGAFCVNPPVAAETSRLKTYQLVLAHQVGLKVPPTIASNDGHSARRFIRANAEQGFGTVVKGVHTMIWDLEGGGLAEFVTARVTAEDIDDDGLRLAPVIFSSGGAESVRGEGHGDGSVDLRRQARVSEIRRDRAGLPRTGGLESAGLRADRGSRRRGAPHIAVPGESRSELRHHGAGHDIETYERD